MSLSYEDVAKIIKIVDASSLEEVVIDIGDLHISLNRGSSGANSGPVSTASASAPAVDDGAPRADHAPPKAPQIQENESDAVDSSGGVAVLAPMVGVFYSKPSPEADPFVEIGSVVKVGDPLGLIEVMKLYTTIYAESAGRVTKVLANEGDLVEYEQPLFIVEPA